MFWGIEMYNLSKVRIFSNVKAWIIFTVLLAMMSPSLSFAGSAERIPERLTSRWQAPTSKDYDDYMSLFDMHKSKRVNSLKSINKELAAVEKLLDQTHVSKVAKVGLQFRKIQLEAQRARMTRNAILFKYRKKYDAWLDKHPTGKEGIPNLDFQESDGIIAEAMESLQDIFNKHPHFNMDPKLLFQMGHMKLVTNNENAVFYFKKIIRRFKKHNVWAKKAQLGLAEYYYGKRNFKKADLHYKNAVIARLPGISHYAAYKRGWIKAIGSIKQKDSSNRYQSAVSIWRRLLNDHYARRSQFHRSSAAKFLARNISRDLVWIWSQNYKLEPARSFFATVPYGNEYYFKTLERIGWLHLTKGRHDESVKSYNQLFKSDPSRKNRLRAQMDLINLLFKNDQPLQLQAQVQSISAIFSNPKHPWMRKHGKKRRLVENYRTKMHSILLEKSAFYQSRYDSKQSATDLKVASVLYANYLLLFPNGNQAAAIHYLFAKSLDSLGEKQKAVKHYHKVVISKKSVVSDRKQAANRMIEIQRSLVKSSKGTPGVLSDTQRTFYQVGKTYINTYPRSSESISLRHELAMMLFKHGHKKQSLTLFHNLVTNFPTSSEAKTSVSAVISYFVSRKDTNNTIYWAERFLKHAENLGSDVTAKTVKHLETAMWNRAVHSKRIGKVSESAKNFGIYQQRFSKSPRADAALRNSMNLYFKVGEIDNGIKMAEVLRDNYQKSKYYPSSFFIIAQSYQSLKKYPEAISAYQDFQSKFPADPRAAIALYRTASLHKAMGDHEKAIAQYATLTRQYPAAKFAPDALLEIAENQLMSEKTEVARQSFTRYAQQYEKHGVEKHLYAQAQSIVLAPGAGILNSAALKQLEAKLKGKSRGFAVKARHVLEKFYFDLSSRLLSELSFINVAYYDHNDYNASINEYINQSKPIEALFRRLVDVASNAGTVEALYKAGLFYEMSYNTFKKQWNWSGLDAAQKNHFMNIKEKITLQFFSKLEKAFSSATSYAKQTGINSSYSKQAAQKLRSLRGR